MPFHALRVMWLARVHAPPPSAPAGKFPLVLYSLNLDGPVTEDLERELINQADAMARRLQEARHRLVTLEELVTCARLQVEADECALRQLEDVLGRSAQRSLDTLDVWLRGARLREVAVQILTRRAPTEPVHYRDWFSWLAEEGYAVAGRDPLASFLAQVSRADDVERVGGSRSGRYRLCSR